MTNMHAEAVIRNLTRLLFNNIGSDKNTKVYLGLLAIIAMLASACQLPDHHLIHPETIPHTVSQWEEDIVRGELKIHLAWARPRGQGPFRTVLVHPHGGKTTEELKGVIWDLASQGYLAVAADYKRMLDGKYRRNTFVWRAKEDVMYALDYVLGNPQVDRNRVALLGFSQGGMLSLLIAAQADHKIKGVVAYYPVSDFDYWFAKQRRNYIERIVFKLIRWDFYRESDVSSEEEFVKILHEASPINHVDTIQVPVLLVHGDADTSADLEESQRLQQKLAALHKPVELLVVPGGVHIFNFRQAEQAQFAWGYTLQWLDRVTDESRVTRHKNEEARRPPRSSTLGTSVLRHSAGCQADR
jgi:dipeptidyl aminopeptidase/acylaminoacyl peptidase